MKFINASSILASFLGAHLAQGFLLPTGGFSLLNQLEPQFTRSVNNPGSDISPYRTRVYPEEYVLQLEVPGLSSEELNLTFKNFKLLVEGEHKCEDEKVRTCLPRSVNQAFYLPRDVNPDRIESTLENGVLTIHSFRTQVPQKKLAIKTKQQQQPNA